MLFLANMLSKMKDSTKLGSRIAEVHNGSSLFTGDAGQGESNIRRWIIENDWLEAIIALPLNMFYNTGIATYIWLLSNRKVEHRKGKVQLIDATQWFRPLRKNLGQKSCELSDDNIARINDTLMRFEESEQSKVLPNGAFGYWKVTVERPLRLRVDLGASRRAAFRSACGEADETQLADLIDDAAVRLASGPSRDFSAFLDRLRELSRNSGLKLTARREKLLQTGVAERDATAAPVLRRVHKPGKVNPDPLHGYWEAEVDGEPCTVEYEPDTELRDTEQVPLLEPGGVEAFVRREVLPYAHDAWIDETKTQIGYEISFNRYFYKPPQLRSLDAIRADILALEEQTDGILAQIIGGAAQ